MSNSLETKKFFLLREVKEFFIKNSTVFFISFFFTVLAYGYFITNWVISIDSDFGSFIDNTYIFAENSLPMASIYNYVTHTQVLPFFNDFIAVCLIYVSSILWAFILSQISQYSKSSLLVFLLIFLISPLYVFWLRFTIADMFVGFDILTVTIAIYFFVLFFRLKQSKYFIISVIILSISVLANQACLIYYFVSLLFLTLLRVVASLKERGSCDYVWFLLKGLIICILSLIIYEITCKIVSIFIPKSSYAFIYLQWGKVGVVEILYGLKNYFIDLLIQQDYNFFTLITLVLSILYSLYFLFVKKRVDISLLVILFMLSPFALVFILGGGALPYRMLFAIPMMMAGMWFLIAISISKKMLNRFILIFVVLCTFYNAQYINRLFYGDVMRYEYDKNFANRIYNSVLNKVGDSIESKPLVILGSLPPPSKPFILRSKYDTIGYSFFQFEGRQRERMFYFMSWLGDDYVLPTIEQQEEALIQSYVMAMPSYPEKNYIQETDKFIIVKLSDVYITNKPHVRLDLDNYQRLESSNVKFNIEKVENNKNEFFINGWAYIKDSNVKNQRLFIEMVDKSEKSQIYPVNKYLRQDISKVFNDGYNLQYSGFTSNINKKASCDDGIYLLVIENGRYAKVKINNYIPCHK